MDSCYYGWSVNPLHFLFFYNSEEARKEAEAFVVGRHDVPTVFSLPLKLYGRTEEVKQLLEVVADTERNVHSRMVFIRCA